MMPAIRDSKTGRFVSNSSNGKGQFDVRVLNQLIENASYSRRMFWRKLLDPRRDIDDECGYPQNWELVVDKLKDLWERESIANRVVEVLPKECWKVAPEVYEDEDVDNLTKFESAWYELANDLRGDSWYETEEGNPIWEYLLRVDILSGIGAYGILLLGVDDNKELSEPAEGIDERGKHQGNKSGTKLLYLRAFDESQAAIASYEMDKTNPRYGQPTEYNVSLTNIDRSVQRFTGAPNVGFSHKVHWSRVIHVADNLGSSDVFGVSRMRPVFNNLFALRKLYGGSAEMYWRGAFPGYSLETNPQLGGDVKFTSQEKAGLQEAMEKYMTGLQRYLALEGMSIKSLAPQVVDPTAQINVHIEAVCIKLGIPKRIFMGSERGELASSQDDSTWNDRVKDRQLNYLTPRLIIPFVDRLICLGILPEPKNYKVVWPDLGALTEREQSEIAARRTEAMAKYIGGNVEALMVPIDFLTRILGLSDEEAQEILDNTMKAQKEQEKIAKEQQPELGEEEPEEGQPPESEKKGIEE